MAKAPGEERWANIADIAPAVQSLRAYYNAGHTRSLAWRKKQLKGLRNLVTKGLKDIVSALEADLRQTEFLARLAEVDGIVIDIDDALENLDKWTKPEKKSVPMTAQPAQGFIEKEPYGVVLLMAPWNYPIRLTLMPLVGALAAGNTVLIKPSEVSHNSSKFIAEAIPKFLDSEAVKVIEGGVPQSTELLKQRFDYIFYTGNTFVGKIVMRAAAEHLTPVTLELGGKSPVIVTEDCDIDVSAKRIVWAKYSNAGQTCVAPDYLLVEEKIADKLTTRIKSVIREFYGENAKESKDYTRIINERHTNRLAGLMEGEKVISGGEVDVSDCYISPTLLDNPRMDSKVMSDEIFGPLLPIIRVKNYEEAIEIVNSRPKPLALYVFSGNSKIVEDVTTRTSSGSVCVNDAIMQIACPELPFGGVGPSGMGSYNGKYTFDTFTHCKTVMKRPYYMDLPIRYPPYTPSKIYWILKLTQPIKIPIVPIVVVVAGVVSYFVYKKYASL